MLLLFSKEQGPGWPLVLGGILFHVREDKKEL